MTAIYERELDGQLNGITGYLYGAFVLLFAGIYVMAYNLEGYTEFSYVLYSMSFILLIAIPLLTMRSFAEEKRQGTDKLLYSLPMSMTKIVMGKYLALVTVMAIPMLILCVYPLIINAFAASGTLLLRSAYGSIVGFFCMGLALTSIGMFISSLVDNTALAAGICFVVLLLLFYLTSLTSFISSAAWASLVAFAVVAALLALLVWRLTKNGIFSLGFGVVLEAVLAVCYVIWQSKFSGLFASVIEKLSVFDRFDNFIYDIFDVTSLVYYLSVAAVFLFLTVQSMERRRWKA